MYAISPSSIAIATTDHRLAPAPACARDIIISVVRYKVVPARATPTDTGGHCCACALLGVIMPRITVPQTACNARMETAPREHMRLPCAMTGIEGRSSTHFPRTAPATRVRFTRAMFVPFPSAQQTAHALPAATRQCLTTRHRRTPAPGPRPPQPRSSPPARRHPVPWPAPRSAPDRHLPGWRPPAAG